MLWLFVRPCNHSYFGLNRLAYFFNLLLKVIVASPGRLGYVMVSLTLTLGRLKTEIPIHRFQVGRAVSIPLR